MATPVILINSATGSDTLASGAGPGTALTGTAGATDGAGTTVTLDNGTNLTGVATDGSHVLYFSDATAGHKNFTSITGSAGSGGPTPTVTVSPALTISLSGKSWAIGGKRASLLGGASTRLTNNNGGTGDAQAGWILRMESGHSETTASRWDVRTANSSTANGAIIIEGVAGAAVMPVITTSSDVVTRNGYTILRNFALTNTGTNNPFIVANAGSGSCRIEGMKLTGAAGTGTIIALGSGYQLIGNTILNGTTGVTAGQNTQILNNVISGGSSDGISRSGDCSGIMIAGNIIKAMGGDGIDITQTRTDGFASYSIVGNTINGCTGSGIQISGDNEALRATTILNNILSNNGAYGLKFVDSETVTNLQARGIIVLGNNTFNNSSGDYLPADVGDLYQQGDSGLDPQFVSTTTDLSIGTNLKAQGYPKAGSQLIGGQGSPLTTYNYVDPGAAQRQEVAGASFQGLADEGLSYASKVNW